MKANDYPFPTLRALSVQGDPGLRGIRKLRVEFRYPLTVLCGKNGSGKSTVLALAALAFHSQQGHFPLNAKHQGPGRTHYTFRDFFFQGPGDPPTTGVTISWEYRKESVTSLTITKQSKKWMRYDRRPGRPVHYIGVARSVPAVEQNVLRIHFGRYTGLATANKLAPEYVRRLGHIMSRPYDEAIVLASSKYSVRQCSSSARYSSFNMGTGEDVLLTLFHVLQNTPQGSLLVIEEIETGLHPEAVARLARHLQEIILEKTLQVVTSTHSQHFLDAVPRVARVLLERSGNEHHVVSAPTTRLALGVMLGQPQPELTVYCEDVFSELLIRAALPSEFRRRVQIVPVGSKGELAKTAAFHIRSGAKGRALIVWDGDVKDTEISRWVAEAEGTTPAWAEKVRTAKLPTDGPPESWVIQAIRSEPGRQFLSKKFPTENVDEIVSRLSSYADPKEAWHDVASYLCRPEATVTEAIVEAACLANWPAFGLLRDAVALALGTTVTFESSVGAH